MAEHVTKEQLADIFIELASAADRGHTIGDALRSAAKRLQEDNCSMCLRDLNEPYDDYCDYNNCPNKDC